ncbi:MAG: hypothetical protein R3C11_18040 [Planctomycetaceae bacterium]
MNWLLSANHLREIHDQFAAVGVNLEEVLDNPQQSERDFVCFTGAAGEAGLATRHYFLTAIWNPTRKELDEETRKLYVLPEDRANKVNVALHDLKVTEALWEHLTEFLRQIESGGQPPNSFFRDPDLLEL